MDQADAVLTQSIKKANLDWFERVTNETWDVQYDHSADLLYINFGRISDAFSMPADDPDECIYLRIDHQSHQMIGVEILHFRKLFLARHNYIRNQFEKIFEIFGNADWRFQYDLKSAANHSLRVLVPQSEGTVPAVAASFDYILGRIPEFAHEIVGTASDSR